MRSRYTVCVVGFLLASCQAVIPRTWELPAGVKSVQVNGYEMAYVERGTGVPVVLVHGLLADYRYWIFQMQSFGSSYRTISISLRHFYPERWKGEGNDFSIRQHAEDLASFIEQSSAGPVHLVAHSRGTDVALRMAKTHPALVRSMVLVDPAPLDSLIPKTPAADAIMASRKDQLMRTLEQYQRGAIDQGLEIFVDSAVEPNTYKNAPAPLKQVWRDNAWSIKNLLVDAQEPFSCADANRLDVPVLLVTGEQSPPIYGLMLNALQLCLPRQEKATIPNASHAMARSHPGPFNAAVLAFLARH